MSNSSWTDNILRQMSLEDAIGQLIMIVDRPYTREQLLEIQKKSHIGSIFVLGNAIESDNFRERFSILHENAKFPFLLAADMEDGLDHPGGQLPSQMAAGATESTEFAEKRGRIIGREAWKRGVRWVFNPVADININPLSSEMNVRTFGDKWQLVRDLCIAHIRGVQGTGVAATAKHFPGAGVDDRDQHMCTSINPMPMKEWRATFGQVWKAAIDAGVMSIMPGHIALPDYDGLYDDPDRALPATLNPRLMQGLLREELGFQGVIVSDAAPMIGLTSRCRAERACVEFLKAGGDVYLFADPENDFDRIMAAVCSGELPEERIWESARRVLELKAKLGIHNDEPATEIPPEEQKENEEFIELLAHKSATIVKGEEFFPVTLNKGDKVLTVTVQWNGGSERRSPKLTEIDKKLQELGCQVDHLENPRHAEMVDIADKYKYVFVNVLVYPHAMIGMIRMTGPMIMTFWKAFYTEKKNCIFTSFGSPYLLHEQPHWPNLLLMYAPAAACQRAAVDVWTGKCKAEGIAPVCLKKKHLY